MKDPTAGPPSLPKSSPKTSGGLKARLSRLTSRHGDVLCCGQDFEVLGQVQQPHPKWPRCRAGRAASEARQDKFLPGVATGKWEGDVDLEAQQAKYDPKKLRGLALLAISFQTLGVVYGDLGTSPLYVFAAVFQEQPNEEDLVGAVSLIVWTLTAILVVKYALIVLRADDNGQGGTFALYSLLKRAGQYRSRAGDLQLTRYSQFGPVGTATKLNKLKSASTADSSWRTRLARSITYQRIIRVLVVLGVGAIMGDGVLTPAISVVSSIEGVQVSFPSVTRGTIDAISLAILFVLFNVQRFGTRFVGLLFSPIIFIWLSANGAIGVYNIAKHNPAILRAFGPNYWFNYFLRNGTQGWRSLGGVVLCITGTEALFADLGHFSRYAIQISTFGLLWPSLILTYLGQAAYLTKYPQDWTLTYFRSVPHSLYWPMWAISILAAIIASQALISAVFSIVFQAIAQGFFPRFHVYHTSDHVYGQVYVPVINYLLMTLTLIVVGTFKSSAKMGTAYGLAVVWDMLLTSHFVTLVMLTVWRIPTPLAVFFYSIFAVIEGLYFSSSVEKIPKGGWFSIMMAIIYASIMMLWFWGSKRKDAFFVSKFFSDIKTLPQLLYAVPPTKKSAANGAEAEEEPQRLMVVPTKQMVTQIPGIALYYSETIYGLPPVLIKQLTTFPMMHKVSLVVTNRFVPLPEVYEHERFLVESLSLSGMYHVIARYGYTERVQQDARFVQAAVEHTLALMYQHLHIAVSQSDDLQAVFGQARPSMSLVAAAGAQEGAPALNSASAGALQAAAADLRRVSFAGDTAHTGSAVQQQTAPENISAQTLPDSHIPISPFSGDASQSVTAPQEAGPSSSGPRPTLAEAARSGGHPLGGLGSLSMNYSSLEARISMAPSSKGDPYLSARPSMNLRSMSPEIRKQLGTMVKRIVADSTNQLQSTGTPAAWRAWLLAREIDLLQTELSSAEAPVFIMGRAHVRLRTDSNWFRRYLLEMPYQIMVNNTKADAYRTFNIPESNLSEFGIVYVV